MRWVLDEESKALLSPHCDQTPKVNVGANYMIEENELAADPDNIVCDLTYRDGM